MPYIQTADHTTLVVTEWGSGAPLELSGRKPAALIDRAALTEGAGHGLYASDREALNADLLAFIKDRSL
jgi:hypothetical protein